MNVRAIPTGDRVPDVSDMPTSPTPPAVRLFPEPTGLRAGFVRSPGSPWMPTGQVPFHVARTVVFFDAGIVHAADPPPRR